MEYNTQNDPMMDVNNAVAEITTIISQHLTKVFEKVSNENNSITQNLKILNQLPFIVNLREENKDLKQQLNILNSKYKSCLEELVVIKSNKKMTMEITELDNDNINIPSRADIESTMKKENSMCYDSDESDDSFFDNIMQF